MNYSHKFSHLILLTILLIFSCKKRDNSVLLEESRPNQPKINEPELLACHEINANFNQDSIYGFLIITRSSKEDNFNESFASLYFSKDGNPIKNYYEGEYKGNPITAKYQTTSTGQIYLKFLYDNKCFELNTIKGFSNIILSNKYQPQGIITYDYELKYDGPVMNTDTIVTCTNQVVNLTDTLIKLKTCNSVANYSKPTRFMINFLNHEYFKIGRKYFIIVKQVKHDFTNY